MTTTKILPESAEALDITSFTDIQVLERSRFYALPDQVILAVLPVQDTVRNVIEHYDQNGYSNTRTVEKIVKESAFVVGRRRDEVMEGLRRDRERFQELLKEADAKTAAATNAAENAKAYADRAESHGKHQETLVAMLRKNVASLEEAKRTMEADLAKVRKEIGEKAFRAIVGEAPAAAVKS